ncbi:hypothetical protein RHMOL_Rhmol10G0207200 [Rhododendron molle]|uniref:Uncharacterized protein n=8 Tax=Rhododendron molle TaxID=49168 RepID=A0ACC0M5Q8_RHOML|nr:hypothetical protein RHMOL_Rhmol10G0207200 [Rhododendron molle]KAI8535858.1 hypothetical protein RHMOL_Rhmol10G0207200 [Rhododendron molle]KAI8535859.1 hypothetical protein RHMOL_Rhmol10G0207200 [Rhododendron molle]KAI8535860.1 hypothetical protein RHMOL_Rhmol10G0207200 [Rhododendron molle]KAI8535861.1 hypothetical protein RHMOL_Rhmol10G0207200 [Rhododendron molle]
MPGSDEGDEVFFDSAENLSSEESVVVKEDLFCGIVGYEIWLKEPKSIKERRAGFLREMGLVDGKESEVMGVERIAECSGAVSSCCVSSVEGEEEQLECSSRELNGEANCASDELEQEPINNPNLNFEKENDSNLLHSPLKDKKKFDMDKRKFRSWWKQFMAKRKVTKVSKPIAETPKVNRMKVRQNKKGCKELSAVYLGQEIRAHEGLIWSMKFSPDGHYLASGGQDGVIRIWHVKQSDAHFKGLNDEGKRSLGRKKASPLSVVIPDKVFRIEELPLQEFYGHTSDVLDLAWSKSNCLLSSSKDKTVRLWQLGCDECLGVFQHIDYVTCIQFNPADENYFITGCIDGKVRIWGVSEERVVDWVDVRDVVTAISYHRDGNGFIVGSITGTCRFYGVSDNNLQLNALISFRGRKKSSCNKITGIQFTHEDSQRVMITSEDSKVRILDGVDIVHKYKGLAKSGSQMSAAFTSTGKHIISVGEDSRVYIWNYDDPCISSSKQRNYIRSCEHFLLEGISLAVPWSSPKLKYKGLDTDPMQDHRDASSWRRDSWRFSLSNWFASIDGSFRSNATWPEEKLPLWDLPVEEYDHLQLGNGDVEALPGAWGLVIVTAGLDGMIRTFHNYGLPFRI